jgi:acetyl-CoA carboxylase biotin carboxyl carrier protein
MSLTAKDVAEIMRLLEGSTFDTLSLEVDGMKLNLRRNSAKPAGHAPAVADAGTFEVPKPPAKLASTVKPPSEPGLFEISAPLLGIYYRAPRPGEPPFVKEGSKIKEDTVIGIIEVMKLMNPVRAGVKGEVVEILVENGAAVEYGAVLLRVREEKN